MDIFLFLAFSLNIFISGGIIFAILSKVTFMNNSSQNN